MIPPYWRVAPDFDEVAGPVWLARVPGWSVDSLRGDGAIVVLIEQDTTNDPTWFGVAPLPDWVPWPSTAEEAQALAAHWRQLSAGDPWYGGEMFRVTPQTWWYADPSMAGIGDADEIPTVLGTPESHWAPLVRFIQQHILPPDHVATLRTALHLEGAT